MLNEGQGLLLERMFTCRELERLMNGDVLILMYISKRINLLMGKYVHILAHWPKGQF